MWTVLKYLRFLSLLLLLSNAAHSEIHEDGGIANNDIISSHGENIRIGITVAVESSSVFAEGGLTGWNETGTVFIFPGQSINCRVESGAVRLYYDGRISGMQASFWLLRPIADSILVNGKLYRGDIQLFPSTDTSSPDGLLTVVNSLGIEDYLRGVVAREIGFIKEDNYEAIKAQAVAARTYAERNRNRWGSLGFDLYATHLDQVYDGVSGETDLTDQAIRETKGEIILYESNPIDAFFHSTCGGATTSRLSAWQTGGSPYLTSIEDLAGESYACEISKYFTWKEVYGGETLARLAAPYDSFSITVIDRDESGRNYRVLIYRHSEDLGDTYEIVVGDAIRKAVPRPAGGWLRSTRFEIDQSPNSLILKGRGWGHGIGMCQMGAVGRARLGFDYRAILSFYYPGTRIGTNRTGIQGPPDIFALR